MPTLYSLTRANVYKTWLLMAVFFGIVVVIGWFLSTVYGNPYFFYIAVVLSVIMNVVSYWKSDAVVLRLTRARPANRQEHFFLYTTVENLAITAGIPMPRVYIIDDPAPNAFATGRNPKNAVVAVTSGLLQILDKTELEGVIAHELSHIKNRDILVSTVAVVLAGSVAILSDFFLRSFLWGGDRRREGGGAVVLIVAVVVAVLAPIFASLLHLAVSRKREFLADASGALLTRYPEGLARALQKISSYTQPMRHASSATAHLFIANPFGQANRKKFLTKLFSTHPPVEERVAALLGSPLKSSRS